jgi:hypothetical protein
LSERLLLGALLLAGCGGGGDSTCGAAAPASDTAVLMTVDGESYEYTDFTSSENNDCSLVDGPPSITVNGVQVGSGFSFALCLPRPDRLAMGLDLADAEQALVVDVSALREADGCSYARKVGAPPTGTIIGSGYCTAEGTEWNLALDGSVPGVRTCGAESVDVTLTLAGQILVRSILQ